MHFKVTPYNLEMYMYEILHLACERCLVILLLFSEIRDGLFVSHCSDNWADAEERCENKKATLASFSDNKNVLGPVHENMKNRDSAKGYWTKSFFTPWMWSNGIHFKL